MQPKSRERPRILIEVFTQYSVGGWVGAQQNQLVILMGMSQAKYQGDYSTQVEEAQAGNGDLRFEIGDWGLRMGKKKFASAGG